MAQIIPLHRSSRPDATPAVVAAIAGARTLRPADVVLLLPVILPLGAAILLLLLGWFVAWLVIVAVLAAAIVGADLVARTVRAHDGTGAAP